MNTRIDKNGKVSAAAKRARERYETVHGEGVTGHAVTNWQESVKPFFDEFVKAVRNTEKPIPAEYFDVGMAFPENPIFAFPYSKAVHCIISDLDRLSPSDLERLSRDVFAPYMEKWELLLSSLEMRFGMHHRIMVFKGRLSALFDRIDSLRFGGSGEGFMQRYSETYTEFRNGFRELAEELMNQPSAARTDRVVRPRYPRDRLALQILAEAARRKRHEGRLDNGSFKKMTNAKIFEEMITDPSTRTSWVRRLYNLPRMRDPTRGKIAKQWGSHLSDYMRHPPV